MGLAAHYMLSGLIFLLTLGVWRLGGPGGLACGDEEGSHEC